MSRESRDNKRDENITRMRHARALIEMTERMREWYSIVLNELNSDDVVRLRS